MVRRILSILILSVVSMNILAAQPNLQNRVDQIVKPFLAAQGIPGAAIAIYYQGNEYIYTYGYANLAKKTAVSKDTIFDLASITKIFTTTLLATQVQAGKLKLDDPISRYLSPLVKTKGLAIDNVKVIDLATHTAGFPRDIQDFGVSKDNSTGFMQALKTWKPSYSIATRYLYSNVSFGLLGKVIEGAAGKDYITLMNTAVLDPLHMNETLVYFSKNTQALQAQGYNRKGLPARTYMPAVLLGGGALRSSAADMLRFLKANMNISGSGPANLLQAMQFAQQPHFTIKPNFIMALGWQRITRNGNLYITKNGSNIGFSTFIGFAPDKKFGVVVLANKSASKAQQLGWQLLKALTNNK